jgi:hypothetical protein
VHISSHGFDGDGGSNLHFEMGDLLGRLQKLTKGIINKAEFKDRKIKKNESEIRLIVVSACQSEEIGLSLQSKF